MTNSRNTNSLASQLLQQDDALSDSQYKDYRRKLEHALTTAERRKKLAYWLCAASFVVSLTLMFVGGSKIIGDFDPWSKAANLWSVAAGVVYLLATVLFFLSLASYFSRFRPGAREARERLHDASILELQRQVCELRKQLVPPSPHGELDPDKPRSDEPPSS
jgi:hypothetical protein